MAEESTARPGAAFWVIAIAFALWNLIGLMFYYQQATLTPEKMQDLDLTAQQIAHIVNTPAWTWVEAELPEYGLTSLVSANRGQS